MILFPFNSWAAIRGYEPDQNKAKPTSICGLLRPEAGGS
jgi:hypothetical protein